MFATRTLHWPVKPVSIFLRAAGPVDGETDKSTPVVYTITEACQVLKVSRWTLYELIRKRQLSTITIGKRRLVPVAAIAALVEKLSSEDNL